MSTITRTDIDGTTPGVAILVGAAYDDEKQFSIDRYVEGENGGSNPYAAAERIRDSVADDFPDRGWKIIANPRARYLMTLGRMGQMGLDWTVEQHLDAAVR